MRNLSLDALTKIATKRGTEPIFIIEIDWGTGVVSYADRRVEAIPGKIIEVSGLDAVIDVQSNSTSQSISVVLDDTSGEIKGIFNTFDVHERPVRVYQWFDGLDLSDKFLLFSGKVTSPISWSEADRTVSFDVLSTLEDREFGFSAEEGEFDFIPRELVGKAWPVIFGTVLDYPALQVNKAVSGSTLCGIGILSGKDLQLQVPLGGSDCSQGMSLALMAEQVSLFNVASARWADVDGERSDDLRNQANSILDQIIIAADATAQQQVCAQAERRRVLDDAQEQGEGCNPVRILGGEDFPQGTPIELNIGGGLFTGIMTGDSFQISTRRHVENDDKAQNAFDSVSTCDTPTPTQFYDLQIDVPPGRGDFGDLNVHRRSGFIICNQPQSSRPSTPQVAQHFWAEPGSRAVMSSDEPISYIASITPGTVLSVKAYKTLNGERKLVNVPTELWSVSTQVFGEITATIVTTVKPLSAIVDQGWDDDLYITFQSDIGPNTIEIMEWIIENYTSLSADSISFDYVRDKLEPFPMNFPVLDRRNTIDLLREITFQARCAMWISNDVIYIRYLPEEPTSNATLTTSNIESGTTEVSLTPTEDIVTKMIVSWRLTWADEDPNKIILRNNVPKYGTKTEEFDLYCFNQPDIVLKVATFWLIRKSNTWKRIRFRGMLDLLNLETYDAITLDLPDYVASGAVKAVIEKSNYDSAGRSIDFECLVPVRAGEMELYKFYWPAALPVTDVFQSNASLTGVSGQLPIGYMMEGGGTGTVIVGGPNVVFRSRSDRGDRTPTDVDFTAQTVIPQNVFANLEQVQNPNPRLGINYIDAPPALPVTPTMQANQFVIDIRRTRVIDGDEDNGPIATLDSIIHGVNETGLALQSTLKVDDGSGEADFQFRRDTAAGDFAAGKAFLKD
jgi:hypothetical protein